ncbi:UDP-glycosyltransferase UGT33D6 [Bombyx mori]|uniref:UDP-glucuronosyltransferase n=1 Tax=Bombyx mori TaxID=7091 RepID=G9LPS7_BOMMO|nr:UDP-glycosyltransferase UGT33D6 [Bombyx mori]AEW43150.1 UDP-glycosyltransferase UGT33D6 [Bombyx mori]
MKFYIFVALILTNGKEAARILGVFPVPSISHQVAFRPLTLELAKRGHELVVLTPDSVFAKGKSPENYTEIDVHDISYQIWTKSFLETSRGKRQDLFEQTRVAMDILYDIFSQQLLTDEFQAILKSKKKFDLLILEAIVRPARILCHVFNAPAVIISSFGGFGDIYDIVGAATHPLLYPVVTRQKLYNLSFWEKLSEMHNRYTFTRMWKEFDKKENEMVKSVFGPNIPYLSEMVDRISLILLNVHSTWEQNRPVPPNFIYVGGIHQKPQQELPSDLKTYLDSSKHGVIYISFGTNVIPSLLPPERIQILIKVFSQLPYDVLWKWDKDELPEKSKNIRISKWLPQSDLLRHPKIKVFITQGGLQSTEEAITAGVPLIGMPMLSDQWYNVEMYLIHKIGLRLELDELSEERLRNNIEEIIDNESYRQNIARLRSQMYDQPQSSLERAVWWTEHVLRHGGAQHLRAAGANLSWSQYLELELVSVLLVSSLITLTILSYIILYLWRLLRTYKDIVKIKRS